MKRNKMNDFSEQIAFSSKTIQQRSLPANAIHNFYLYGSIASESDEYVDMITTLDYADEGDTINIYINTPGGDLDTTVSIIHAMMRSKANVVSHADGRVASAGTLIFFAAKSFVVYPYAGTMFHDASSIIGGKANENLKSAQATVDLIRKICMDLYVPYFSEDEVNTILAGGDYYCDADELYQRVIDGVKIIRESELDSENETDTVE